MFKKKDKKKKSSNVAAALLCFLLLFCFAAMLVWNAKDKAAEKERLEQLAVKDDSGIEDYEEIRSEMMEKEDSEESDPGQKEGADQDAEAASQEPTDGQEQIPQQGPVEITGIACWGDDLINGDTSATYSYMAVLERLLAENGYSYTIFNKTLQGGGTLSMMKMAGVPDEVLQNYIDAHRQAAGGTQPNVTETGIRDLTEEQLNRDDKDGIPVIFMGYYGGWNHDPNELAEQQERILNTFTNQDKFIVVGTRPMDGTVDSATLDNALSQKWGEHYISLANVTTSPASTYDAQSSMAQAILQKLEELGYITKQQ